MNSTPQTHHLDRRADTLAAAGVAAGEGDDLLNTPQLAQWLGVSTQFLEIARHKGIGPAFVRVSPRRIRYRRADVLAWLAERTRSATAEYTKRRA
jgi:predicted DNA-binding transcriptional regulator AlpA